MGGGFGGRPYDSAPAVLCASRVVLWVWVNLTKFAGYLPLYAVGWYFIDKIKTPV